MADTSRRSAARCATAAAAAVLLVGCSAAVTGQGNATSGASPTGSSTQDFPSGSPASSNSERTTPVPSPTYREIAITGTASGRSYVARVYASDSVADCAAHAYGARMIAFLRAHPCRSAHRVIATIDDNGRTAVVSAIAIGFVGTAADPYAVAEAFIKLERADGTGSINDLFREGRTIPGIAARIPSQEAFQVEGQDNGVTIFDAWWATGSTPDQAPALLALERELFLTPLTSA